MSKVILIVDSLSAAAYAGSNEVSLILRAEGDVSLSDVVAAVETLLRDAGATIAGAEPANEMPDDPPAATATTGRTRARGAAADAPKDEVSRDTTTAQEGAGRGRQRTRTEASAETAPAATTESTTRRRRSSGDAPAAPPKSEITDADLSKACSDAAAVIGIELVMLIMKEDHAVEVSGDIPKDIVDGVDQRQNFLDTLAEQMELAKAEGAA